MIGDIYQVTTIGTLQQQTIENVFHYRVRADADSTALVAGLLQFFETNFLAAAPAIQSVNFKWTMIRIQKIWPLPARLAQEFPEAQLGALAGQSLPAEVAMVLTKQTILAGRANRGRTYIAGMPATTVDAVTGRFGADIILDAADLAGQLTQVVPSLPGAGTLEPVIYHRASHGATVIESVIPRNVPRAQRRRQVGKGI